jgi:hypothetical protein
MKKNKKILLMNKKEVLNMNDTKKIKIKID